jgi:aminoglycoside phosphotransferase (APT) family kinase protein
LRHVDSGFFSHVFETASGWIIRVARTEGAGERQIRETRFLPWVAGQLAIPVPDPCVLLPPSEGLPYGGVACPRIRGSIIGPGDAGWRPGRFAGEVAAALATIHSFDTTAAAEHGIIALPPRPQRFSELRGASEAALRTRLDAAEMRAVSAWWAAFFADDRMDRFTRVVTHGDPWWGNILQQDGHITGLLDWEHAALDDPAMDLAQQVHGGWPFMDSVVSRYAALTSGDEAELAHRAGQLALLREFYGVWWAERMGDEAEMQDSITKLRAGPILGRS